jgi:hypothetical protein
MRANRKKLLWAAVLLPAFLYVAGYFVLSKRTQRADSTTYDFSSAAIAFSYAPLGWTEAKLSRRRVLLLMPGKAEFENRMICFEP